MAGDSYQLSRWWVPGAALVWLIVLLLLEIPLHPSGPNIHFLDEAKLQFQDESGFRHPEWQSVKLPHYWDSLQAGRQGRATYQLSWWLDEVPGDTQALLLPRVGNDFRITINHVVAYSNSLSQDSQDNYAEVPQFVILPRVALRQGLNEMQIDVVAHRHTSAGLSPMWMGARETLSPFYSWLFLLTDGLVWVVVVVCIVTAPFALWTARAISATTPAWFAFGCLMWAMRLVLLHSTQVWGLSIIWRWNLSYVCYLLFLFALTRFSCMITRALHTWVRPLMAVWLILSLIAWVFYVGGVDTYWMRTGLSIMLLMLALPSAGLLVWQAWRQPRAVTIVIVTLVVICVMTGVRDFLHLWVLQQTTVKFEIMRPLMLLPIFGVLTVLIRHHAETLHEVQQMNQNLEQHIALREGALEQTFIQAEAETRRLVRIQERERFYRELHAGLGALLMQSRKILAGRQDSSLSQPLIEILDRALDELRQTVDSLALDAHDCRQVLAIFREQVEEMLHKIGIQTEWQIDLSQKLPRLDASQVADLYRLLQEGVTNVIKHSQATMLQITCCVRQSENGSGSVLELRLKDNGKFLEPRKGMHGGYGMASMRARAERLQASLQWLIEGDGTTLVLLQTLPKGF